MSGGLQNPAPLRGRHVFSSQGGKHRRKQEGGDCWSKNIQDRRPRKGIVRGRWVEELTVLCLQCLYSVLGKDFVRDDGSPGSGVL